MPSAVPPGFTGLRSARAGMALGAAGCATLPSAAPAAAPSAAGRLLATCLGKQHLQKPVREAPAG